MMDDLEICSLISTKRGGDTFQCKVVVQEKVLKCTFAIVRSFSLAVARRMHIYTLQHRQRIRDTSIRADAFWLHSARDMCVHTRISDCGPCAPRRERTRPAAGPRLRQNIPIASPATVLGVKYAHSYVSHV